MKVNVNLANYKGKIIKMNNTIFDVKNRIDHTTVKAFLDESGGPNLQRYDTMKYKYFDRLVDKQLGFFWRPEEVDLYKDIKDFRDLSDHEQHIFTSNLKRQVLLDSVQGRAPIEAFGSIVSLPELENWFVSWTFSETIHSRSYTYIIQNVYSNPSKIFDEMLDIQEIVDCAEDITKYYDSLIEYSRLYNLLGYGVHNINGDRIDINEYELKKRLWLCLMSVNILEGVRFYVSFACSFAFGELKKMEGNAKIIKLICRDENLHLSSTQTLLKTLLKDDEIFVKIQEETKNECENMFYIAAEQEKEWCRYLFKDGSIIGLNVNFLSDYVEYITKQRMNSVGLNCDRYIIKNNPLPWTLKWINGSDVQVAPQETQITSYILGGIKQDINENTFKDIIL